MKHSADRLSKTFSAPAHAVDAARNLQVSKKYIKMPPNIWMNAKRYNCHGQSVLKSMIPPILLYLISYVVDIIIILPISFINSSVIVVVVVVVVVDSLFLLGTVLIFFSVVF